MPDYLVLGIVGFPVIDADAYACPKRGCSYK
jgi:hypothetical protein